MVYFLWISLATIYHFRLAESKQHIYTCWLCMLSGSQFAFKTYWQIDICAIHSNVVSMIIPWSDSILTIRMKWSNRLVTCWDYPRWDMDWHISHSTDLHTSPCGTGFCWSPKLLDRRWAQTCQTAWPISVGWSLIQDNDAAGGAKWIFWIAVYLQWEKIEVDMDVCE